jgi:hypothetical protein
LKHDCAPHVERAYNAARVRLRTLNASRQNSL